MSAHKHHEHLQRIKNAVKETTELDESQKSQSIQRIEEWIEEDKAFGTLKEELMKVSIFFEGLFSELGIK